MSTTRMRGLVLGVLLASCAALPAAASAQTTAPTLTTSVTCLDAQGGAQDVDITASGLAPDASYFPQIELTEGEEELPVGYGTGNLDTDATGSGLSNASFDGGGYADASGGDGSGVWLKLRSNLDWTVAAQLRIPLCGVDSTPPSFAAAHDVTAEATGADGAAVTFDTPAATDDVDGAVPATCTPASGSTFPSGHTTVDCSATDAAGNTGTTSFVVTVADTTAPSVTVPAGVAVDATSASGAAV